MYRIDDKEWCYIHYDSIHYGTSHWRPHEWTFHKKCGADRPWERGWCGKDWKCCKCGEEAPKYLQFITELIHLPA